jgi:muramoyltetrapeptide carboxypeptidase
LINKTIFIILTAANYVAHTAILKPFPLNKGDTVAIVAPSFLVEKKQLFEAIERLESFGLNPIYDDSILNQYGYFAGTEEDRADAINKAIRNDKVKAIFPLKGGYGCATLLDKIDYEYLTHHPKIIIGRSDLTALLIAIYTKSNLASFYGPNAASKQSKLTMEHEKDVLFQNNTIKIFSNDRFNIDLKNDQFPDYPAFTINSGIVRGPFIGGNLSVLVSLIGTAYFPKNWQGKILFLEDTNEDVYKIDRMLGQLKNAGVLNQISGFVFGTCKQCKSKARNGFSLNEVLERYFKPLHIPAYSGAMIGHEENIYTVPIGTIVEINAQKKQIQFIESPTINEKIKI